MTDLGGVLKSKDITLSTKVHIVKVWSSQWWCTLWELEYKEGGAPENWCFWTVALEKTPESPTDSKELKSVNLKVNQPWILIGRTDAEATAPVFGSPDANSWLTGKVPDAVKDWGQEEERVSEDDMVRWDHWCNGHDLGQTSGDSEGQEGLECCNPWGHKELDMTGRLNNSNSWGMWDLVSWPGTKLGLWDLRVLATGPLGRSLRALV